MTTRLPQVFEFGPFQLDTAEHVLSRQGEKIALTPKAFETLIVLVERRGSLVTKDELMGLIWPDTTVEEANLTNNVWALRKALDNGQNGHSYIETVPKLGYRFTAEVRRAPYANELIWERHTQTRVITEEEDDTPVVTTSAVKAPNTAGLSLWKKGAIAAAAVVLLAGGFFFVVSPWITSKRLQPTPPLPGATQLQSIAILPFKTSGDTDSEYLSVGLSDALIARLGNLRQLVVRPASATRRYAASDDAVAAGREQGVDAVLDGSVQRNGDRIRVSVQLLRVSDGAVLWAGQFDENLTDMFALQDSISGQVAQGLLVKLSDDEQRRLLQRKPNVQAYQEYLKGRYFWNKRTEEGSKRAIQHFQQAIDFDPSYAQAYAGLADAMLFRTGKTVPEIKATFARSKAALQRAIELDESLAEPHATLGLLAMNVDWDWPEAERQYKRAIELNPNYATAHHWYGEFLASMGRFDQGLAELQRAQELDPLSLIISTDLGKVYFLLRDFDRAVEQARKTLELDPEFTMAHVWLGFAYSLQGKHAEAISELQKTKGLSEVWSRTYLGYVYGRAGQREAALKILQELKDLSQLEYVPALCFAIIYTSLGDNDRAFEAFDRTFTEEIYGLLDLKVNPGFDTLRSDPRFADLLKRARLAD